MNTRKSKPYGPGNRKKGLTSKDWVGVLLVILVVVGLAGVGYWRYSAGKAHVAFDAASFCPIDGAFARTVLLIDLTDEISFIQEQKLKNFMRTLAESQSANSIPQYTMLSVYLLSEDDTHQIPTPVVEVCNPGSGEGLSEFTGNPRLANKRFTERFLEPIDEAIGAIVRTQSAKSSPIIESIRGISISAFAASPQEGYEHRLIVISDMLQHSANTSHYRDGQSIEKLDSGRFKSDLGKVSRVDIKVIDRQSSSRLQGKELVEYWREYFRASGSSLDTAERWGE